MDDILDSGGFVGNNIHELLKNMNNEFYIQWLGNYEFLRYKKNKWTLLVVDYKRVEFVPVDYFAYKTINLSAIKSIYINESHSVIAQYVFHPNPRISSDSLAEMFGCVVFIETYPDGEIPVEAGKGVRKTWLDGYSPVREFYSPDYSTLPSEIDYRRTLYWNPTVTPDGNGRATITFYNNSRSTHFSISAETVTPLGAIGILR